MKLNENDWKILFPGKIVKVGTQNINIKALGLKSLSDLIMSLEDVICACKDQGITLDNYQSHYVGLASIILNESPEILALLTEIDVGDIKKLPVSVAVELLVKALEVNLESQEDLSKNLYALVGQVAEIVGSQETGLEA